MKKFLNNEYQIWRENDIEGDVWSEDAFVFPKEDNPEDYFTEDILRQYFDMTEADEKHYDFFSVYKDGNTFRITIAKGTHHEDGMPTDYDANDMYYSGAFWLMSGVKIFDKK